jgi:GNAT superfamily N-acetyltransferase
MTATGAQPAGRGYTIRAFRPADETGWVRCRALAFLDTAYSDDVHRQKERYDGRAIELVAEADGQVVGLIDVECEETPGEICSAPADPAFDGPAGMIWHLAVHPDYRRRGIGGTLLVEAAGRARAQRIRRFEAWTRDDPFVIDWYRAQGFRYVQHYWHLYMGTREELAAVQSRVPGLRPVSVFAHYLGDDEAVIGRFERAHRCNRFDLYLEP